jgi:thymidylate synthase
VKLFGSFPDAIVKAASLLEFQSHVVHTERWQSMDISKKPEMATHEVLNFSFQVPMATDRLEYYQNEIQPNLPWADRHFEMERVSGLPINPGTTWREWPYALSADKFRTEGEQFSHSYAERYWPKHAHMIEGMPEASPMTGIRYDYGDLLDVVALLKRQPLTRQAILPVWFPEDTGAIKDQRVPCSISYHFIRRFDRLHIVYQLRSCDFVRHFRDDIYLTVRLLLWVLERLRELDPAKWESCDPGIFTMHITSLHLFANDYHNLFSRKSARG